MWGGASDLCGPAAYVCCVVGFKTEHGRVGMTGLHQLLPLITPVPSSITKVRSKSTQQLVLYAGQAIEPVTAVAVLGRPYMASEGFGRFQLGLCRPRTQVSDRVILVAGELLLHVAIGSGIRSFTFPTQIDYWRCVGVSSTRVDGGPAIFGSCAVVSGRGSRCS